jgi:hypothetical protein
MLFLSATPGVCRAAASRIDAPGRSVHDGRCYPVTIGRSSRSFCPLEGFTPRTSASCFHEASSHGLQYDSNYSGQAGQNARTRSVPHDQPSSYLLCRVSKNRGSAGLFRELPPSSGFPVLVSDESECRTKVGRTQPTSSSLRRTSPERRARAVSPPRGLPLIALSGLQSI